MGGVHGKKKDSGTGKREDCETGEDSKDFRPSVTDIISPIVFHPRTGIDTQISGLSSLKGTIYFDYLMYDERLYHEWAKALAEGTFKSSSVYEMAPLPAYFMALIYRLYRPM